MLFGAHVSSAGGISKAIDRAEELGCHAVQVFTQSPRMWKPTAHAPEEVERFRTRRDEVGIAAVVCHALYLVNLAAPDREIQKKSVAAMRASLETAGAIGAEGVVFHVGSHLGKGQVRADGSVTHAMFLFQVKTPAESKGEWDYFKVVSAIPPEEAFGPMDPKCPLVSKS